MTEFSPLETVWKLKYTHTHTEKRAGTLRGSSWLHSLSLLHFAWKLLLAKPCHAVTRTGGLDDAPAHTSALIKDWWDQTLCILPLFLPNPLYDNKTLQPVRTKMGKGDSSRNYLKNKEKLLKWELMYTELANSVWLAGTGLEQTQNKPLFKFHVANVLY